jgi:UDP-2,3-diacylglucosamine hydrolase
MMDAVFISDLHLHPQDFLITERFHAFVQWASKNTNSIYILGDLFHVWPGDDAIDPWSESIAAQLSSLASQGIALYFMPGNRDFLLGERFLRLASLKRLREPTVITLGENKILLVHGDRYCTRDTGHVWLRRITRNIFFPSFFLSLPRSLRLKIVFAVRHRSQSQQAKSAPDMAVVESVLLAHMKQKGVHLLIHGHTHQPGLTVHEQQGVLYHRYVLSDWDDNPLIVCYDKSSGFYFTRL